MRVEQLLKQLKREFVKVNLIQASLDSILFFLSTNLALFFFSIQIVSGVSNYTVIGVLTVFFLLGNLAWRIKNYRLEIYEEENPELREVLRTARDNLDKNNIVSQALFDDVMDRARKVTSDSIIPSKVIIQKILAVGALSFLTVISGITDAQIGSTNELIQDGSSGPEDTNATFVNSSRVLGEPKDINVNESIDFTIQGNESGEEPDVTPISSGDSISVGSSPSGLEEDLQIAKEYSLEIKDIE
jgi:hypothetical protein